MFSILASSLVGLDRYDRLSLAAAVTAAAGILCNCWDDDDEWAPIHFDSEFIAIETAAAAADQDSGQIWRCAIYRCRKIRIRRCFDDHILFALRTEKKRHDFLLALLDDSVMLYCLRIAGQR